MNGTNWMGKSLVFIVVLVMVLTGVAVNGLINAPMRRAEAAGVQVGVDRQAAELAADVPGMPAIAAARQAQELEQIDIERNRVARDWWIYQQAQDEQLRLTRAQNDQTIAQGQMALERQDRLGEWAIYTGAFAAAMVVLVLAYATKRVIDRKLPPAPVALPLGRELPARAEVIIEGQLADAERPLPARHDAQRSPAVRNAPDGIAPQGNPPSEREHHSHNGPVQVGFIGIPTGQPRRERVTGR